MIVSLNRVITWKKVQCGVKEAVESKEILEVVMKTTKYYLRKNKIKKENI